ncbi:carbohydrate kinase family protein [candidate division KSB1 bacterium]|nr:carbohydrate kinase family protein [candidate division KSB1 bacterium]
MPKLDCLGFGLVTHDRILLPECFPRPNQKLIVKDWHEQVGGPVAVGIMAMAALGLRVHWGLALPSTPTFEIICTQFRRLGVTYVEASSSQPRPVPPEAILLIEQDSGERTVLLRDQPHYWREQFEHVQQSLPEAGWLYNDARDYDFTMRLKTWAHKRGMKVFLDIGGTRPHWEEMIAGCEVVIVSDDFMRQIDADSQPEQMLARIAACGVAVVGMTLGKAGSVFMQQGKIIRVPGVRVEKPIDTTNAGDVFHGAFLSAWIKTHSLETSAELASRCAAWTVTQVGHNLNHLPGAFKRELESL